MKYRQNWANSKKKDNFSEHILLNFDQEKTSKNSEKIKIFEAPKTVIYFYKYFFEIHFFWENPFFKNVDA